MFCSSDCMWEAGIDSVSNQVAKISEKLSEREKNRRGFDYPTCAYSLESLPLEGSFILHSVVL